MWERLSKLQRQANVLYRKALLPPLSVCQIFSVCRIGIKIFTYKTYVHNSDQSDFNPFTDYIQAEIISLPMTTLDLLKCQGDTVMQPAGLNLK